MAIYASVKNKNKVEKVVSNKPNINQGGGSLEE